MENLNTNKKLSEKYRFHLFRHHITTEVPDKELNPGATIFHKDSDVGTIVQSLKENDQIHSLAVIRNDASTKDLSVEGMKIIIK